MVISGVRVPPEPIKVTQSQEGFGGVLGVGHSTSEEVWSLHSVEKREVL